MYELLGQQVELIWDCHETPVEAFAKLRIEKEPDTYRTNYIRFNEGSYITLKETPFFDDSN